MQAPPSLTSVPSLEERGFALAAIRLLGPRGVEVCRARHASLGAWADTLRDPRRLHDEESELAEVRFAELHRVHPSWFDAPPRASRLEAQRYLDRVAFGSLAPPAGGALRGLLAPLERLDGAALELLILALGRRRVATAFANAPRAMLAQLCARLGEPEASRLVAQVRAIVVPPAHARAAQRALLRMTISEPASPVTTHAPELYAEAAAGWIAPLLEEASGDAARWLAQRLPRALGQVLLRVVSTSSARSSEHDRAALAVALEALGPLAPRP